MGFVIITLQFIISSRQKWFEKYFGLDITFSFHKAMAMMAGLLVVSHPILLAFGSNKLELLTSLSLPWYVMMGKFALLLILIQVILGLFRQKLRFGFQKWRASHNVVGGLLLLAILIHSLFASGGDLKLLPLIILWIALFTLALGSYTYHKLIMPMRLRKNTYTVKDVKKETPNVWTLTFEPPSGKKRYDYYPGQFHFLTLHRGRGLPKEEHHFTISSSPTQEGMITSSIKESGDFTAIIGETKKGDPVSVEGPFGRFSHLFYPDDWDFIFIAGGIGITPIRSMLKYMHDTGADANALLIYANHSKKDIAFRDELDGIGRNGNSKLKVVHVLSHPDNNWQGESGYVNEEILDKYIDDYKQKSFYICCPDAMRKAVMKILKKRGVKSRQIRMEVFSL